MRRMEESPPSPTTRKRFTLFTGSELPNAAEDNNTGTNVENNELARSSFASILCAEGKHKGVESTIISRARHKMASMEMTTPTTVTANPPPDSLSFLERRSSRTTSRNASLRLFHENDATSNKDSLVSILDDALKISDSIPSSSRTMETAGNHNNNNKQQKKPQRTQSCHSHFSRNKAPAGSASDGDPSGRQRAQKRQQPQPQHCDYNMTMLNLFDQYQQILLEMGDSRHRGHSNNDEDDAYDIVQVGRNRVLENNNNDDDTSDEDDSDNNYSSEDSDFDL